MNIQECLRSLTRAMESKWRDGIFLYEDMQAIEYAERHRSESHALHQMLGAIDIQAKREAGEFHLSGEAMTRMWKSALELAAGELRTLKHGGKPATVKDTTPVESFAERSFKQRARSVLKALADTPEPGHANTLRALASAEGFGSYQALKAVFALPRPAFCPHCGTAGSLQAAGEVYCEQGGFNGKEFEAEGDAPVYRCTRCNSQFANWDGADIDVVASRTEAQSSTPVSVVHEPTQTVVARCDSIEHAEGYIAQVLWPTSREAVERGDYGIDAPEHMQR